MSDPTVPGTGAPEVGVPWRIKSHEDLPDEAWGIYNEIWGRTRQGENLFDAKALLTQFAELAVNHALRAALTELATVRQENAVYRIVFARLCGGSGANACHRPCRARLPRVRRGGRERACES